MPGGSAGREGAARPFHAGCRSARPGPPQPERILSPRPHKGGEWSQRSPPRCKTPPSGSQHRARPSARLPETTLRLCLPIATAPLCLSAPRLLQKNPPQNPSRFLFMQLSDNKKQRFSQPSFTALGTCRLAPGGFAGETLWQDTSARYSAARPPHSAIHAGLGKPRAFFRASS